MIPHDIQYLRLLSGKLAIFVEASHRRCASISQSTILVGVRHMVLKLEWRSGSRSAVSNGKLGKTSMSVSQAGSQKVFMCREPDHHALSSSNEP
jgi:hypothetical protein